MGDLGKLIGAKGFKKMPKVQKIAQSGHTARGYQVSMKDTMCNLKHTNAWNSKNTMCGIYKVKGSFTRCAFDEDSFDFMQIFIICPLCN